MVVNPDDRTPEPHTESDLIGGRFVPERGDCAGLVAQFSTDPVWAPDGSRILFVHTQIVHGVFSCDLQTIAPDGGAQVVAETPECEDEPDWESIP